MQLNIIRKDSTPSGQEELHTESVTVTVKEGAEEPVVAKPGVARRVMCTQRQQKIRELDACVSDCLHPFRNINKQRGNDLGHGSEMHIY